MASWAFKEVDCSANNPPSINTGIQLQLCISRAPSKKFRRGSEYARPVCDGYHKKADFDKILDGALIVRYLFLVPAIVPLKASLLPRNTDHTLADNCLDVPVLDNSLIGELGLDQSPACGNLQIGGHYEGTVYCGRRRRNASPGFRDGAGFIADLS